jgi:N-acetylglucosaminyl-diphospho-decaprenol L-rhamnosyltransferase
MTLSVVTVIHDSARDLDRLLASLDARLAARPEVIVVDSGSSDDGAQRAAEWGAEVVALGTNAGFGAANNAGVARARQDLVALLNPDVELLDDGLERLAAAAAVTDALHAPRLLNADGTIQDSAHPLPGTARELARAVAPGRLRAEPWRTGRAGSVGWAIAAALVARRATLTRLGPFDPAAFLFYEDLDLGLRARSAGVPTVLHPDVALRHAGAHSTGPAFGGEPVDVQVRRRRAVVGARLGPRALALDDAAQLLEHGVRGWRARDRAHLRAILHARG